MREFIKMVGAGILRLPSITWSILTYPYRAIRSLLFKQMYPACTSLTQEHAEYQKSRREFMNNLRSSRKSERNLIIISNVNIVNFDLKGNMQHGAITEAQRQDSDNMYFDAAIFTTDSSNIYNPNKQFIIMAGGNATCYEQYRSSMHKITDPDTNVIGFNPMGIGMSPGVTNGPDDYQAAIKSIIENLHKNDVPYDHIVLQGYSLGAAMCLSVAEQYQMRGERVKVIADRTFSRLDNTAATMLWLLYVPIKLLINLFGLNVDAASAFNNINRKNPGDAIGLSVDNDGMLPDSCSLYNSVSDEMRQKGFVKKFAALSAFRNHAAHGLQEEYIAEKEDNLNKPTRRRSGAKFISEYRQIFKSQMSSIVTTLSAAVAIPSAAPEDTTKEPKPIPAFTNSYSKHTIRGKEIPANAPRYHEATNTALNIPTQKT